MSDAVEYRVRAHNPAESSENRIHADDVARRYGFQGGLVPGVTVYGYLCQPIMRALGEPWLDRGTTRIKLVGPCYQDETLTCTATAPNPSTVELRAAVGERTCAVGTAAIGTQRPEPPLIGAEVAPSHDRRPPADADQLSAGRVLGAIPLATDQETADAYLAMIGEPLAVYRDQQVLHPGLLAQGANWVLVANVVLPAWVHVETEMWHRRRVAVGEGLEVRARVAETFERKGHQFVALEAAWLTDLETVATARHTAIWRLAEPDSPAI